MQTLPDPGFISRSVHARLQVSVYSGNDLWWYPGQHSDIHSILTSL